MSLASLPVVVEDLYRTLALRDAGTRRRRSLFCAISGSMCPTAVVAREFALPAVVAAANATSSLVDGEEVTVDGTRGVVTRS